MIQVTIADYIVNMAESIPDSYGTHAALIEEFGLDRSNWDAFYLMVERAFDRPFLHVAQRYWPDHWAGSHPGILLVPETHILFVGAGERLLAYDLQFLARLWKDRANAGFHRWRRHGDVVVLSAELELAAWDIQGAKLWTTLVEPPWEYHLNEDAVQLDVMGIMSTFPLRSGPASS